MLGEIRLALLEADVNFKVVKTFVDKVRERAIGQEVLKSLTPAQQVVSIVHDQLIELLGEASRLVFARSRSTSRSTSCCCSSMGRSLFWYSRLALSK